MSDDLTAAADRTQSSFLSEVRRRLAGREMKQSELAAQIRVDRSLITQWFSGHQRVTQDQAVAVAGVLGEDLIDYFAADLKAEAQRRAAVLA